MIASSSGTPELIAFGTNITPYFSALAVPTTALALTDRLAIRYYVTHAGRTITMHTENSHLCQIITTFSTGLTALNGLTAQVQNFATGTNGTDFNIESASTTHVFNLPTASGTNRGALSSDDWSTFNSKVSGTGASGQVAFWNGTSSQTGSADFVFASSQLTINRATGNSRLNLQEAGVTIASLQAFSGAARFANAGSGSLELFTNGVSRLNVFPNGNIGINTTTDAGFRLDVNGTARVQGNLNVSTGGITLTGAQTIQTSTGNLTLATGGGNGNILLSPNGTGAVGLSVVPGAWRADQTAFQLRSTSLSNFGDLTTSLGRNFIHTTAGINYLYNGFAERYLQISGQHIWSSAPSGTAGSALTLSTLMTLFQTGNLVVQNGGTHTDAGFRLDVNGTARVQGELTVNTIQIGLGGGAISTNTRVGLNALRDNTTGTNNTAFGLSGLQANTTGTQNTAVGVGSLISNTTASNNTATGFFALGANTTGINNTAFGSSALRNSTTSSANSAFGLSALQNNTTGGNNTAVGGSSSQLNTTGSNNTTIGTIALLNNTTGGNNTAIGQSAARFIADGTTALTIANNSIFIGVDTRANANSETNQIVIGHTAIGLGSNTTVLGNTSTTHGRWYGSLLLGTTTNAASSILTMESTTQGFLPPRMTTTQRNAIATPATGLVVYDTTLNKLAVYTGAAWETITSV